MNKLQQVLIGLNAAAEKKGIVDLGRRVAVNVGRLARKPADLAAMLGGVADMAVRYGDEVATWIGPDDIASGKSGPFDACDLRHWLEIAQQAGVPATPAVPILSLSEEEMSVLSGKAFIPDNAASRRAISGLQKLPLPRNENSETEAEAIDREALWERLHQAMDEIPEGWMVRYARCGSSELKALAGAGAAGVEAPEVRFGPELEVGPGWVRTGNRRRVNVSDSRTVKMAAEGPGGPHVFLARPWEKSARYKIGEDPHRHGTPFAGKGAWPAEWRAFVENGQVTGVSYYYGWSGEVSPLDAMQALKVRKLAQSMVDLAQARQLWPRFLDIEMVRDSKKLCEDPVYKAMFERFGREMVACTLDFIETEDGLKFLEGGPAHTPLGGGHPCSFAGVGANEEKTILAVPHGVAFRLMDHVIMADPGTWQDGERAGCILDWDEVEELAQNHVEEQVPQPR